MLEHGIAGLHPLFKIWHVTSIKSCNAEMLWGIAIKSLKWGMAVG
jgi:hypothetical protein